MKTIIITVALTSLAIGAMLSIGGNELGAVLISFSIVALAFSPLAPKKYKSSVTEEQFNEAMENIHSPKL